MFLENRTVLKKLFISQDGLYYHFIFIQLYKFIRKLKIRLWTSKDQKIDEFQQLVTQFLFLFYSLWFNFFPVDSLGLWNTLGLFTFRVLNLWFSICFSFCGRDWRNKNTELLPGDKAFCLAFLYLNHRKQKPHLRYQARAGQELDFSRQVHS